MHPAERSGEFGEILGFGREVFLLVSNHGSWRRILGPLSWLDGWWLMASLEILGQKEAPSPTRPIRQHGGEARQDGGGAGSHPLCSVPCPKGGRDGGADELAKLLPRQTAQSTSPIARPDPCFPLARVMRGATGCETGQVLFCLSARDPFSVLRVKVPSELASEES